MGKQDNVIRLVLIEDSAEDAEQIVSQLRNGGMAVRPHRPENRDQLADILAQQEVDLVLANGKSRVINLPALAALVEQSGKDRPIVAILPTVSDDIALQLMRDRVRAYALRGNPDHLQAVVRREFQDLTQRRAVRKLEAALRESERRCDALLDSSRDPIAFIHEGMHVRANKAYLDMFGFRDFEEIEGTPILDMIAPDAADGFKNLLKRLSKGEKPPARLELRAQNADGNAFDAFLEFAEATFEGEPCQQITFRQNLGVVIQNADQDLVTGLYTRAYFLRELDHAVSQAAEGQNDLALMFVEPDNFKNILDTIGLASADLLLADVARVFEKFAKPEDVAARMSDTAFVLLIRRNSHEDAAKRAAAVRRAMEDHIFEAGGKSLPVPVSVGLVMIGEKIANADAILGNASRALKQAQDAGGNQIKVFDPAAQDKVDAEAERAALGRIQDALKNNGFVLFYQPIISLHGAEGEFYEILLRLQGPNGEIMPAEFFPIAEKYNLLPAIDRWVVASAVRSLAEREKAGHKTTFFLKLTVPSLEDPTLLPWIAQHLKSHRVGGDKIVFEMPESKVTTNLKPVREFLKGLAQLHCGFAVQQFGSGLNSFQLLKHIDCQYLKIDRTFMPELPKNKENQQRVKELCDQAHSHGKLTIAEFVEDAASMSILFTFGVNFVQGNFLQEAEKVMSYEFA